MRSLSVSSLSLGPRSLVLRAVFFLFAILAAYETAQYVISGDYFTLVFLALAAAGCAVAVAILNSWRNGLFIFFGWLLFEDLVRKYLGNNMVVYFGKDVLAAVLYVSFMAAIRR